MAGASLRLGPATAAAAAQSRNVTAQDANKYIDQTEVVEFAKELCRIPSFTTEETKAAEFIDAFLKKEGFDSQLQEVDPGRFQTIARLRGSGGGRSIILDGHIDIDPIPSGLDRDPFKPVVEGDRFFGAGIGNMKAGVTAIVMGAVAAKRAGLPLKGDVVVAAVVGELQGGIGTVHMLKSGVKADMAIVAEQYGTDHVVTKHTGVIQLAINVTGRSAHISRKQDGLNAILKATKVAEALERLELRGARDPELPALPLWNVGSIIGGRGRLSGPYPTEIRGPNNVPDYCAIFVDIRFQTGITPQSITDDIRRTLAPLAAADPDLKYEIEFPMKPELRCLREVMMPFAISPDEPLVRTLRARVRDVTGKEPSVGPILPSSYAGNDTSHLFAAGIPCCLYGPSWDGNYAWSSVDSMMTSTRVFAAMIADVCA